MSAAHALATGPAAALDAALLTEAVRVLEAGGPLEDGQALRSALRLPGGRAAQVAERARVLGERRQLSTRLQSARTLAPWVLAGIALLVSLAGFALAGQIVDAADRRINVLGALALLLGAHLLTLLLWLAALALSALGIGAGGGAALGRLWLQATGRLALGRGAEAGALLRALTGLLDRARLLPWVLGFASHAIWALSFAVAIGVLLFALAFRRYTLAWETTLLAPETFVAAVHALSIAPAWLGIPVPDAAAVLADAGNAGAQRDWAWWLLGCVALYGLLPRLLLAALCATVWRARRARLQPDLDAPYYRKLFARLDALAPAQVVDPDTHGPAVHGALAHYSGATQDMLALIGFELPAELPWPPQPLPAQAGLQLNIAGSAAERLDVLQALAQIHPRTALVACNAAATPDRGTERFLRELLPHCGACRLWLTGLQPPTPAQIERWTEWLAAAGLTDIACSADWAQASAD